MLRISAQFAKTCLLPIALGIASAAAAPTPQFDTPHAPPPPILEESRSGTTAATLAATGTQYSIGDPSDLEQYYLELINRARANPVAEAERLATTTDADTLAAYTYFGVDLSLMRSEFAALPVRPPLAFNQALGAAALAHANDLHTHAIQSHTGTDGSTPGSRATAAGYSWTRVGENIYSYAQSVFNGHAGFEVDWGWDTGGMQAGRGHRMSIHGDFREIGIAVIEGSNTVGSNTVGPQIVVQDFGTSSGYFLTGVAYYDLDGNGFYTPGEGIGGLTVEVDGETRFAVTTNSGGYAVPVTTPGAARTVRFHGLGADHSTTVSVTSGANAKLDFAPTYQPPTLSGPVAPVVGQANAYTFTAVPGATSYVWRAIQRTAAATDGANNLNAVSASVSAGYQPLSTSVKRNGSGSYHLVHPIPETQTLRYPNAFYVGTAARITYYSRLGWASPTQVAKVEVSTDGTNWIAVDTQAGVDGAGQAAFAARQISLAAYAGRYLQLRFTYSSTGSYYSDTGDGMGWYIDDIGFDNVYTTTEVASGTTTTTAFNFTPSSAQSLLLSVRPQISGRSWTDGSVLEADSTNTPQPAAPAITTQPAAQTVLRGGTAQFKVQATGYPAPTYSWRKGGVTIFGATAATLSLTNVQPGDAGSYNVVVTNASGSVTSSAATLTVATTPSFTTQPTSVSVTAGASVDFTVACGGSAPISYQWYVDGLPASGRTSANYGAFTAQLADNGKVFHCTATNAYGATNSQSATLHVAAAAPPTISSQPVAKGAFAGQTATLSIGATNATSYQWFRNGRPLATTTATLDIASLGSADVGLYDCLVTGAGGTVISKPIVVGIVPTIGQRTSGAVTTRAEWQNIQHPNGAVYDQFLLSGTAGTFTADANQIARMSFLDENESIVQVEMSGAGAVTVVLDPTTAAGPMAPALYNQSGIQYMKGKATIVLSSANQSTHFTIYSVGTATNPGVTRADVDYAGWADVAAAGIISADGKLGGIHQGNVAYNAEIGHTGIYAPNVASVASLVVIHDISAGTDALPFLQFAAGGTVQVKIAGGSLAQTDGDPITAVGLSEVQMGAGQDSCGRAAPAQTVQARLLDINGTDITSSVVTGP